MRFSSIFATARFPSKNVFAIISPIGGGIIRINDSTAATKSFLLNETNAMIGHTINPNNAAIAMPAIDEYGSGITPIIAGKID